jgi:Alpha/beta hydrolase family
VQIGTIGSLPLFAFSISSLQEDNSSNRWVLYFHGSDDNTTDMWDQADFHQLRDLGFHVLAPEYRGYSGKPGQSTEQILEQEAQRAYDYLRNTYSVPESNIVIFGTSLGTGVAVDLASRVRAGALVLNAPCTSVIALGRRKYSFIPLSLLLVDRFESDKMPSVHMPVFIHHTLEDKIIPFEQGQKLYELAGTPKHFERGHGYHCQNSYSFFVALQQFLNESAGLNLHAPHKPISAVVAATLATEGLARAVTQYRELRAHNEHDYNFAEYQLNWFGRTLLEQDKQADAIAILELNAEQFPNSFDVYDSLGDPYLHMGDKQAAEQSFRRSLQVYPGSDNYSSKKLHALLASTNAR